MFLFVALLSLLPRCSRGLFGRLGSWWSPPFVHAIVVNCPPFDGTTASTNDGLEHFFQCPRHPFFGAFFSMPPSQSRTKALASPVFPHQACTSFEKCSLLPTFFGRAAFPLFAQGLRIRRRFPLYIFSFTHKILPPPPRLVWSMQLLFFFISTYLCFHHRTARDTLSFQIDLGKILSPPVPSQPIVRRCFSKNMVFFSSFRGEIPSTNGCAAFFPSTST